MAGINKVILIGNIGKIDARTSQRGDVIVSASLATSYKKKDSNEDVTEWHNLTFFGKVAEIASKYVTKGSKIYVEGSLKTDKWQDKGGVDHYTTKIIVSQLQLLGNKQDSEDRSSPAQSNNRQASSSIPSEQYNDLDDAIPF